MDTRHLATILLTAASLYASTAASLAETTHIRSHQPAQRWRDAMLSGNGLTGVMQFGEPLDQRLVFNSHRFILPNGAPVPIPDMADAVEPMRDKMLAGKIGEAWADCYTLLRERGNPPKMLWTQSFHPGYVLRIKTPAAGKINDYSRVTNYRTGEIITGWTDDRGQWRRRTFVSRSDDLVVTELAAPTGAPSLDCTLSVEPAEKHRGDVPHEVYAENQAIGFRARYPRVRDRIGGYEGRTRIVTDGETQIVGEEVEITSAKRVLLITQLARYRDDYKKWEKGELAKSLAKIDSSYDELLARHLPRHQPLFGGVRMSLDVKETDRSTSTEDLITRAAMHDQGATAALLEKLYGTSQYLQLIGASRNTAGKVADQPPEVNNQLSAPEAISKQHLHSQDVSQMLTELTTRGYLYSSFITAYKQNREGYSPAAVLALGNLLEQACIYTDHETIELLPAVPRQMPVGTLDGLKGRNGVTIEHLGWDLNLGKLDCRLKSRTLQTLTLIHRGGIKRVMAKSASSDNEIRKSPLGDFARKVRLPAGEYVEVQLEF